MFKRQNTSPPRHTISVQGQIMSYRDEGKGPTILLLHGALINSDTWRFVIGPLSRHYRCISPDLPLGGHFHAVSSNVDLTPPGIASLLHNFVEKLNLGPVVLVGNDTGGAYAQVYAAAHPEAVSHLVLSNTDALDIFPPAHFSSLQKFIKIPGYLWGMAMLFRLKWLLEHPMAFGLLSNSLSGTDILTYYAKNFIANAKVRLNFRDVVNGWSPDYTLEASRFLSGFKKPTLLMWGEEDKILFPVSLAQRLARVFPNAQLDIIAGSMTYVQEDQPEEFVERLLNFLDPDRVSVSDRVDFKH